MRRERGKLEWLRTKAKASCPPSLGMMKHSERESVSGMTPPPTYDGTMLVSNRG